jgi:hypothetical protein
MAGTRIQSRVEFSRDNRSVRTVRNKRRPQAQQYSVLDNPSHKVAVDDDKSATIIADAGRLGRITLERVADLDRQLIEGERFGD